MNASKNDAKLQNILFLKLKTRRQSGYGSIGSVVASDIRDPQLESSRHRQISVTINVVLNLYGKTKKEAGNGPFKKEWYLFSVSDPYLYRGVRLSTGDLSK